MTYYFSYEDILKICPTEAAVVVKKIRSGRSQYKNLLEEEYDWTIELFQMCHAYSLEEVLDGVKKEEIPFEKKYSAQVSAKKGKAWATCGLKIIPDIIVTKLVAKELTNGKI